MKQRMEPIHGFIANNLPTDKLYEIELVSAMCSIGDKAIRTLIRDIDSVSKQITQMRLFMQCAQLAKFIDDRLHLNTK